METGALALHIRELLRLYNQSGQSKFLMANKYQRDKKHMLLSPVTRVSEPTEVPGQLQRGAPADLNVSYITRVRGFFLCLFVCLFILGVNYPGEACAGIKHLCLIKRQKPNVLHGNPHRKAPTSSQPARQ